MGQFGVTLNQPLEIGAAFVFSALVGLIAYRGISGSTMTAVVINAIQLTALVGFAILAIAFRLTHPDLAYAHSSFASVVLPHNFTNVLFQGTIAILLLVGFESVTALGGEAINPKRDVRRAVLLSLAIQGAVAYVIEYVAANFFVNSAHRYRRRRQDVAATPPRPPRPPRSATWSGYRRQMLGGTGFPLVIILAATVLIALIGTTLACLNTGVRITYVMGRDKEVPGILGMLHFRHATPHYGVIALAIVSAVLGGYAVLSADNLLQITLASNTGTFLVYGMTNALWSCLPSAASTRGTS